MARLRSAGVVVVSVWAAASGGGAWSVAAPAAQFAGATQAVPAEGTGRITGRVIAADTGAPVRRVPVSVYGGAPRPAPGPAGSPTAVGALTSPGSQLPPGMLRRDTVTDEAGRFECVGLPPGRYTIMARASGAYLAPPAQRAELADGGSAAVTLQLVRGGSIVGRVLDDEGEPVEGARVSALQRRSSGGVWRLAQTSSGSSASTNDLGQFRLYGLPAGEFYVRASYAIPMMGSVAVQPRGEARLGFVPTFHPSAAVIDGARKVTVTLGRETDGIDLTLVRGKLGSVSGRVTDSAGTVLTGRQASVMLVPRSGAAGGDVSLGTRWPDDGSFIIGNVPPGRYLLVATVRRDPLASPDPVGEAGFEPVAVDGDDVTVHVQTNTGATVSGRVVIEGTKPVQGWRVPGMPGLARATVMARQMEAEVYIPSNRREPVHAGEDLTFSLTGLRGRQALAALVPGAALKSVTLDGKDLTASGLWLKGTESIEGVTITVTTDTAAIDGQVVAADGSPVNAWLVVFPDDSSKWFAGSPFVRVLQSRPTAAPARAAPVPAAPGPVTPVSGVSLQAGGFRLPALLPGRYAIAAMPVADPSPGDAGGMPPTDPETLAALRARATMVSVAVGETATVQLKLLK